MGGIKYTVPGNIGPGVGSVASREGILYFGSTCRGGVYRVPLATLLDQSRSPDQRAADITTVSPRPPNITVETIKGLSFNRFNLNDRTLYANDSIQFQILAIDVDTGARRVIAKDPILFNFPVGGALLPPLHGFGQQAFVVASDQEYRFSGINTQLTQDIFQLPFLITQIVIG